MKKSILILMAVMMALLLSGCSSKSSEESKVAQDFKNTAKENLKLLQSDKSNVDIARELAQNIYNVTCKTYKVSEPLISEETKLHEELKSAKAKAVFGWIDRGSKDIFSLADEKSADKMKKELEPITKKVNEFNEKHKEYIQAANEYSESVKNVILRSNQRRNEDYRISLGLHHDVYNLARNNNYKELKFSNSDVMTYLLPNHAKGEADYTETNTNADSVLMGEITDKRAKLVATLDSNPKVIRSLNVGEKFLVLNDNTGGPNIKIKMLDTGEEGYAWYSFLKYEYVKKDAVPQVSQNSNNSVSSSSNVSYGIINANEVNVRKGPGKNYKSLGVFFKGDKLRLVSEASDAEGGNINWYQIEFDNPHAGLIKGWVRKDFINLAK